MMIQVLYSNRKYDVVKNSFLEGLIRSGKVMGFRRADGWVTVGKDIIRGQGGFYNGPERRREKQA